jgi:hypothetical protein
MLRQYDVIQALGNAHSSIEGHFELRNMIDSLPWDFIVEIVLIQKMSLSDKTHLG